MSQDEWVLPRVTLSFREADWVAFRAAFALKLDAKNAELARRTPRDSDRPLRVWGFARWLERAFAHLRAKVGIPLHLCGH